MQVFVEKCKYLEESKCIGICLNTCKFPTQVCSCQPIYIKLFLYITGYLGTSCSFESLDSAHTIHLT